MTSISLSDHLSNYPATSATPLNKAFQTASNATDALDIFACNDHYPFLCHIVAFSPFNLFIVHSRRVIKYAAHLSH
jgi:hypothetical protein